MSAGTPSRAPALFISHGAGPFPIISPEWKFFRDFLQTHKWKLEGVKGIILFSAHWETDVPHVTAADDPGLYYDYADDEILGKLIPPEALEIKYPVRGDSKLATDVAQHLRNLGWDPVLDYKHGLDHGVFVPMLCLRPEADIPIVQVSLLKGTDEQEATKKNLRLGRAVEHFRDLGYAIISSGASYHDFWTSYNAARKNVPLPPDVERFEDFLLSTTSIADPDERERTFQHWRDEPSSYVAHVKDESEHFMPFLVASGAGGHRAGVRMELINGPGGPMSFYEW
ncbi:Extradiol ring-cleavage dioxygenase, class III enzyme, subunit B [Cadophora sp. MPI-SDFR-AT-0126]|nr:Extradiol ring-cleavage dioxygenase, class III enzyme, subunit B [Leotiomycetes sp. MPI-SDFR-AT-0126]